MNWQSIELGAWDKGEPHTSISGVSPERSTGLAGATWKRANQWSENLPGSVMRHYRAGRICRGQVAESFGETVACDEQARSEGGSHPAGSKTRRRYTPIAHRQPILQFSGAAWKDTRLGAVGMRTHGGEYSIVALTRVTRIKCQAGVEPRHQNNFAEAA